MRNILILTLLLTVSFTLSAQELPTNIIATLRGDTLFYHQQLPIFEPYLYITEVPKKRKRDTLIINGQPYSFKVIIGDKGFFWINQNKTKRKTEDIKIYNTLLNK